MFINNKKKKIQLNKINNKFQHKISLIKLKLLDKWMI